MRAFKISIFFMSCSLGALGAASPVSAQSVFCPAIINSNGVTNGTLGGGDQPYALTNGNCTNGVNGAGAFSGAALASQALSTLSQSTTNETNRSTVNAIENRRAEELNRCPAGQIRTSSGCEAPSRPAAQPFPQAAPAQAAARRSQPVAREAAPVARRSAEPARAAVRQPVEPPPARGREPVAAEPVSRGKARHAARPAVEPVYRGGPVYKGYDAPPPVLVVGPRYGVFAQGFGDYERRSGNTSSFVQYNDGAALQTFPFLIRQTSNTETFGFLAGADMTLRDNITPGDGAIFGLMAGYTNSQIQLNTQTTSLQAPLPNGAARTNVRLEGPSVSLFLTYFSGGFSFDQTLKADFFRLNQNFQEAAGFAGLVNGGTGGAIVPISGNGSTDATLFSALGNMNFRFPFVGPLWIEPTVGYQYTRSIYGASGQELNLTDGDRLRLQGGLRFGYESFLAQTTRMTLTVTGLAYNNVLIEGGFIAPGVFGSNVIALNDRGQTRGQGVVNLALDYGNGISSFIQGDVRGGEGYFGAGGRAGIRYQW